MKGLNQFQAFDWDSFSQGKSFVVTGISEYQDYDTKKHLGTKVDCVIASDNTQYSFKEGESFTNRYEKISFKVSKDVVVLQIKLCSILQIIWNRFWCCYVNIIRLFGVDSALCFI